MCESKSSSARNGTSRTCAWTGRPARARSIVACIAALIIAASCGTGGSGPNAVLCGFRGVNDLLEGCKNPLIFEALLPSLDLAAKG